MKHAFMLTRTGGSFKKNVLADVAEETEGGAREYLVPELMSPPAGSSAADPTSPRSVGLTHCAGAESKLIESKLIEEHEVAESMLPPSIAAGMASGTAGEDAGGGGGRRSDTVAMDAGEGIFLILLSHPPVCIYIYV